MFESIIRSWGIRNIFGPQIFSAFMGFFASKKVPKWMLNPVLKKYVKHYHIDMGQFEGEIGDFASFTDFFTRKLKPNARQFQGRLLSPADSIVTDFGKVSSDMIIEVKGMACKLSTFLKKILNINFKSFAIFYLSPADYHRFHAPFDMQIEKIIYVPGDLYSVNPKNVDKYDTLFCDNRKIVLYGNSEFGKFAMVLVGALVVGKIILNFGTKKLTKSIDEEHISVNFKKGEELGAFELGSTVILLTEKDILDKINISKGEHVHVGQNLID